MNQWDGRLGIQRYTDALEKSFAGLMLQYTHGDVVDMRGLLQSMQVRLTSVRECARAVLEGQRLADLSLLTWQNVDLNRNEIRLVTKKTGKRLTIPMSAPLRQHVLSLPADESPDTPIHPRAFEAVQSQGRA